MRSPAFFGTRSTNEKTPLRVVQSEVRNFGLGVLLMTNAMPQRKSSAMQNITKHNGKFKANSPALGGWFRFYNGVIDDPKIQRLAPHLVRGWINLLCLASKNRGALPSRDDVAFRLRMSPGDTSSLIDELIIAGLIDILPDGNLTPHNWSSRQNVRDKSAGRMRRLRERRKGGLSTAVTLSDGCGDASRDGDVPISTSTSTSNTSLVEIPVKPIQVSEGDTGRGDTGTRGYVGGGAA